MYSLGKRYFSVRSSLVQVCVCVVDQIYNMVSKRLGVILVLFFKQVEDP